MLPVPPSTTSHSIAFGKLWVSLARHSHQDAALPRALDCRGVHDFVAPLELRHRSRYSEYSRFVALGNPRAVR